MAAVTKSNGKYTLLPDPLLKARAKSAQDMAALDKGISESELHTLLARILLRLDHLEHQ
jgi:hypothetical protein